MRRARIVVAGRRRIGPDVVRTAPLEASNRYAMRVTGLAPAALPAAEISPRRAADGRGKTAPVLDAATAVSATGACCAIAASKEDYSRRE